MNIYYLASLESIKLDEVRKCEFVRNIKFNTGKNAVVAKIDKPIVYSKDGEEMISDKIIIAARHENYDVLNISYCPTFVYVTVLKEDNYFEITRVKAKNLITIGIGELYRSYDDAKNHKFD